VIWLVPLAVALVMAGLALACWVITKRDEADYQEQRRQLASLLEDLQLAVIKARSEP
jgi:hypothetical protein